MSFRRSHIRRRLSTAGCTLLTLLISGLTPVIAQQLLSASGARFVHEEWTAVTGLPVNQLTGMLQSRDGYLWFSTFDGLVRFDGVRFTVFNSGNSRGLPTNRLTSLLEDERGSLWIQSEQGHILERRDGEFVDHTPGVGNGPVQTIYTNGGSVWAGTPEGVHQLVDTSFVPLDLGELAGPVLSLYVDSDETLWIGTARGGLYRTSERGRGDVAGVDGLGPNNVHLLAEDPTGNLWIGGNLQIFRLGRDGLEAMPPHPSELDLPLAFHFPEDGPDVWYQAWSGPMSLVDGKWVAALPGPEGRLDPVIGTEGPDGALWAMGGHRVFRDGEELLVSPGRIERMLFDHEGTVWASGEGLHKFRPAVIEQRGTNEGLVDNAYVVHGDRIGRMWFGSIGGGLVRLDENGVHRFPTDPEGSGLSNIALAVHEDRRGEVWVGLWDRGVCRLDAYGCAENTIDRMGGRLVRGIHEDRRGSLWFGTDDGILVRDSGGEWRRFGVGDGLPHPDVRTFVEDRLGRVWVGTYGGGVARWDGDRFEVLGVEGGLSSPVVRALHMDAEGILWIGTEGMGLNRVVPSATGDRLATHVTVYRVSDGLYDEGIHRILEDDFDRLWMSTNRGIFWVAKNELTAFAEGSVAHVHSTFYTERDGLLNRELNGGVNHAGVKDRHGHLWFGGIAGVARVDPATIVRNQVPPPVDVEELWAGGLRQPIVDGEGKLAARDRDFEIAYTALSFAAPENVRFRYVLEGFNERWIDAGGRRTAFYTNVPPGEYVFRVVASNNDGVWNEEGATLTLTVAPYLHETWPARGGLLIMLALSAFGAYRYRERYHRRRAIELEEIVQARTKTIETQAEQLRLLDEAKSRFFANVSHELRTPLTLTIGPLEDVREGLHGPLPEGAIEDVDLALRSSRRLLRLVNQILDVAKLEAGEMELRAAKGDLAALLGRLVSAFAPLAERRRVSLRLRVRDSLPDLYFDPDLMEKVFTNLLSNALKFTPEGGAVLVSLDPLAGRNGKAPERLRVSVKDSGPGIPEKELPHLFERFHRGGDARRRAIPGTGIGLSLARELVELHGGTIDVESEEGFGTTFAVTLCVGKAHLPPGAATADDSNVERLRPDAGDVLSGVRALASHALSGVRAPAGDVLGVDDVRLDTGDDLSLDDVRSDTGDDISREDVRSGAGDGAEPFTVADDGTDGPLVLVVDDNADVRSFVRRHLTPRFRVVEAGDGSEALRLAGREVPDLIISDVIMPGMDGLDFLRKLKTDPELDYVPVVLLSARAELDDRVSGFETGADDYLTKPFHSAELVARVDNLIRSRQRLRARRPIAALRADDVEVVSSDERFLNTLQSVVEEHVADEDFDVEGLADALGISRSALYRRLADLNVGSPADVIRSLRLERAAQLLAGRAGSVSEVAYGVGFKSVSHFSRSFRERYGVTPSAYRDGSDSDRPKPLFE